MHWLAFLVSQCGKESMNLNELKRSMWDKQIYYYLSKEDSSRLDELKDSDDPKDQKIVRLILDKAEASRSAHCASRY